MDIDWDADIVVQIWKAMLEVPGANVLRIHHETFNRTWYSMGRGKHEILLNGHINNIEGLRVVIDDDIDGFLVEFGKREDNR